MVIDIIRYRIDPARSDTNERAYADAAHPPEASAHCSACVVVLASDPAGSGQTGWPIGFWWAELTHPYWELTERGYRVDVASPDGGKLEGDTWSDPRDESKYSADDLISLGFVNSAEHMRLI